jgi:hypothetical protein
MHTHDTRRDLWGAAQWQTTPAAGGPGHALHVRGRQRAHAAGVYYVRRGALVWSRQGPAAGLRPAQ